MLKKCFKVMYAEYASNKNHHEYVEFTVKVINSAILQLNKNAAAVMLTAEHLI